MKCKTSCGTKFCNKYRGGIPLSTTLTFHSKTSSPQGPIPSPQTVISAPTRISQVLGDPPVTNSTMNEHITPKIEEGSSIVEVMITKVHLLSTFMRTLINLLCLDRIPSSPPQFRGPSTGFFGRERLPSH
jgi:hypothetical protein